MDQIRINATPNRVVVSPTADMVMLSPTAPQIKIRLTTGPQGPAGPPAEIYVQQTQPPTPQNVGAIWYETDTNGNIQAEHVWDGMAWLPTPTATGISTIVPVAPITASGTSVVSVGVDAATDTTPGVVARMATAGDVAAGLAGPAVDAAVLKSVLPSNTSDLNNDGDGVGGPFVDATAAGNAAPVQSLIAGNNIDIVSVGRDFTISAISVPQHQSDWQITDTANPGYIKNKPTNVSAFANDSGYITAADVGPNAPVQSVNGMTGAVVIDLSPYATNADLALTNAKFADYLPLVGGTISGGLTVAGAFNVGPAGTARVPTVAATDASTAVATTEWVQSLLAATGSIRFMWKYGGDTVNVDPGLGNLDINIGNTIIAISKTDGHGNQRYLDPIASGDTIVLTDDPATGPATEYQRFDVIGTPTDNGNWVSIPVSLAGGTSPTRVVGEPMRVTIGLDSQVATIEGVSAGYGLTGGGVSGVVTLAADLNVMAQLTDIPTVVSAFTNDAGYTNATEAAAAAPIQEIVAGTDISIVANPGKSFTVNAIIPPQHQTDWAETNTGVPTYIKNKPTNVSAFTNDAGYITAAQVPPDAVTSVNAKTGVVVLNATDVGAVAPGANTSTLTNNGDGSGGGPFVDYAALSNELVDYLPLAGGTMTGNITWATGAKITDPAANTFAVSTSNTERFRIDANGQILAGAGYVPGSGDALVTRGWIEGTGGIYLPLAGGTMTGAFRAWAGSAAFPGISWDGDVDTGIYHSGPDSMSFSTGGAIRGTVNPDGTWYFRRNVGIGTPADGSIGLNIGGTVSTNSTFGISVGYSYSTSLPSAYGVAVRPLPAAGAAITNFLANWARPPSGSGGVVNYVGFRADVASAASTTHYGFQSLVDAQAGKTRYGVFADGTAQNRFDGPVVLADGTAAAPALAFTSDENVGLFRPAADVLAASTGGTERFRIGPEGSLGIGVAATSANQRARFNASITGATTAWEVRATGQVQSDVTADAIYYGTAAAAAAGATTARLTHYYAASSGVPSTVPLQVGFWASSTMTGAQQNHGIRSDMADTGTNYNIYVGGAAPSYFNGRVGFGTNTPDSTIDVDGVATFSFGAAAAPSIVFRGTAGTGVFSPATNVFAISTAGTERLRVGATGQITAAAGYTPTAGQDLATKAYVDAAPTQSLTGTPDGTAAAPAIAFANDPATGIFRETATGSFRVSVGGFSRFEIDTTGDCYTSGWLGVAVPDDATAALDVNGESIRIRQSVTPANATATGNAGEIMWDAGYLYVCVATNTWKRVALSSW